MQNNLANNAHKLVILNDQNIAIGVYQVLFAQILRKYVKAPLKTTFRLRMSESVAIDNLSNTDLQEIIDAGEKFFNTFGLSLSYSVEKIPK